MIERITEDVYMLLNLTTYLKIAAEFEDAKFCGENGRLFTQALDMVEEIMVALANMSDTDLPDTSTNTHFSLETSSESGETSGGRTTAVTAMVRL